jgi:CheY-like chemotaxis protein
MACHNGSGGERDTWVMVDEDGQQTLFRLVEMGGARDVARLTKEFQLPVVMIDVAVPRMRGLEATSAVCPESARGRLIVLNLHTVSDDDAVGLVAYRRLWGERIATFDWRIPPSGEQRKG